MKKYDEVQNIFKNGCIEIENTILKDEDINDFIICVKNMNELSKSFYKTINDEKIKDFPKKIFIEFFEKLNQKKNKEKNFLKSLINYLAKSCFPIFCIHTGAFANTIWRRYFITLNHFSNGPFSKGREKIIHATRLTLRNWAGIYPQFSPSRKLKPSAGTRPRSAAGLRTAGCCISQSCCWCCSWRGILRSGCSAVRT